MPHNLSNLPHQSGNIFLTDGGLETTLVFLQGFELPYFAACHLLNDAAGYQAMQDYYRRYLTIAQKYNTGFILESPTWRANPDWLKLMGYSPTAITDLNTKAIKFLIDLKDEFASSINNILISGCVGPRGDGYRPENLMTAEAAQSYHAAQINVFSQLPVDLLSAMTINYVEEAIGIVQAANSVGLPVVISFTLETNGKLPTGMSLEEAITLVDSSVAEPPIYYMINCAHPTHFLPELQNHAGKPWLDRIKGIRANASCKSHAELDEATELDSGNPTELGQENKQLKNLFKSLNVFGGCCGTDERHVLEIAKQVAIANS
ncbi:homocysteine S-methyltransferase family protein [Adhaeribacter rhizoryzae]|uniref:Homocysteine S-methyltransferase n=1 Tax=Adhaeribacter rhizoryzae TaxID=2607907 RepID=A0A5M6DNP2_9BACT|nr:homocysteine S-methyltransferase family protein [Adhaeribacter rhizoryzae]KAA5549161.1 homocysteine S-methyltransferase [Adhaeribacter rhizoryzae]